MKVIKRIVVTFIILITVGLLFRGWFYRHLVTYKSVGQRSCYLATDDKLVRCIEANVGDSKSIDIKDIIKLGLSTTSAQLHFSASNNENDPNKLINTKTAHCVGYASFFATSCNYLLRKYNFDARWAAKPQPGQLYVLGINIHQYVSSPFFKDHDFVTIENKTTREIFAVDPTVNDYFGIDFITFAR